MKGSISKHISIDEEYLKKIEPYLDKNDGNFGKAIKDILKSIDHLDSTKINKDLLNWLLSEIEGMLIPEEVLDRLVDPTLYSSIEKFGLCINNLFEKWNISLGLKYDNEIFPSEIIAEIKGPEQHTKFVGCIISQYFAKSQNPLGIISYSDLNGSIKIEFHRSTKEDAYKNLKSYFGIMDDTLRTIKKNPKFWKFLINTYVSNSYNMIYLHKNYFEDFLGDKIPSGELIFEAMEKKPIQDIPLQELLYLIKINYEASKIVDRVDIDGNNIILYHNYRNDAAKEKIKKFFINILEQAGHIYNAKMATNLVILNHSENLNKSGGT